MSTNRAYFRVWQSGIDESYLPKLGKAGIGGAVKPLEKRPGRLVAKTDAHWESAVVEWHGVFDEVPLRRIAANLVSALRRLGRPDDLNVALHIEVHVDWELPHTGVPLSPSTLRLLADLDATVDIDIVPDLKRDGGEGD